MARRPAVPAKIVRPVVPEALPRPRLFDRLDEARNRAVVWIAGPAGSGKTTLAASYVASRGLPCVWYQVDSGDEDLATFFYYLGLAGHAAAPRRKKRLPLLTPEYHQGVPTFSRNFFEEFFHHLGGESVLVLDDCHEITPTAPLHGALLEGLNRLPEGVTVLLTSRGDPPPLYARLRTHGCMDVIGWEDLRLTLAESGAIVGLRGFESPLGGALDHLHARLGGWAAGLQLLLQANGRRGAAPATFDHYTPEEVFDYFGAAVFDRLETEVKDFLLKTSFLPSITTSMAAQLTGHHDAGRLLSDLHRRGDFTEKRVRSEPAYQYHPLFREFLQRRAARSLAGAELGRVRRTAAGLMSGGDQPEDAIQLLLDAQDWDGLAGLVRNLAPKILQQGRNQSLLKWLSALPASVLEQDPWLLYWLGAARLPYAPPEAQACFEQAFAAFRASGEPGVGLLLSLAGVVTTIWFAFFDFHAADPWLAILGDLVGRPGDLPPGEASAQLAAGITAILVLRAPSHPDFSAWEARALDLEPLSADPTCRTSILGNLAYAHVCCGSRAVAGALLERLCAVAEMGNVSPVAQRLALHIEAAYCYAYDALERSRAAERRALAIGEASGVRLFDFMNLVGLVRGELIAGDLEEASTCVDRMGRLLPYASTWDQSAYRFAKGSLHLAKGELEAALRDARESVRLSRVVGAVSSEIICRLLAAEVAQRLGDRKEASRDLAAALRLARRGGMRYLAVPCLLLAARGHFEAKSRGKALAALRRALKVGREIEACRFWSLSRNTLAQLCAHALREGIEVDYVRSLIRHNRLDLPAEFQHLEGWPRPLHIHTLGGFQVLLDGQLLRAQRKTQRRPLNLLKALISFGGRDVAAGRLADALWPDADGDAAHRAFATALYRLRRLLNVKDALVFQEGRLSLSPRHCWVDTWAMEVLLGDAVADWKAGQVGSNGCGPAAAAERALALYRGSFLPDDTREPWSASLRDKLRRRFLQGVEALGARLEASGCWEEAAQHYLRAVEADPLLEFGHQRLMVCYQELGKPSEALVVFERFRRRLQRSMSVEPSRHTRALADRIRKQESEDRPGPA